MWARIAFASKQVSTFRPRYLEIGMVSAGQDEVIDAKTSVEEPQVQCTLPAVEWERLASAARYGPTGVSTGQSQ